MNTEQLKQMLDKRATMECDLMNLVQVQKDLLLGKYVNPICELSFEKSRIVTVENPRNIFDEDGFIKREFLDPDKASGKAQTYGSGTREPRMWNIFKDSMWNRYGIPGLTPGSFGMDILSGYGGNQEQSQSERSSIGQLPINDTLAVKILTIAIEHITEMLKGLDGMIAKWYEDNGQDYSKNSVVAKVFNNNNRDEKI